MNFLTIAELVQQSTYEDDGGQPKILIQAQTDGSALRLSSAFPALDGEAVGTLLDDGFVVIELSDKDDATTMFGRLGADLMAESTLVSGCVKMFIDGSPTEFEIGKQG